MLILRLLRLIFKLIMIFCWSFKWILLYVSILVIIMPWKSNLLKRKCLLKFWVINKIVEFWKFNRIYVIRFKDIMKLKLLIINSISNMIDFIFNWKRIFLCFFIKLKNFGILCIFVLWYMIILIIVVYLYKNKCNKWKLFIYKILVSVIFN